MSSLVGLLRAVISSHFEGLESSLRPEASTGRQQRPSFFHLNGRLVVELQRLNDFSKDERQRLNNGGGV